LGWAGPGPAQHNFFGAGSSSAHMAGLDPASLARPLAQASGPARQKPTRSTRAVYCAR